MSVEEHIQLTTAALMQRDAPCWSVFDEDDDVISIHEDGQSNMEMVSTIGQPRQHTEDSSVDSAAGDSDHHSNDSNMESDQDRPSLGLSLRPWLESWIGLGIQVQWEPGPWLELQ